MKIKPVADLYELGCADGNDGYTSDASYAAWWLDRFKDATIREYVTLERYQEALADQWTPCSTELPPHGEPILFASGGKVYAGHYSDGRDSILRTCKWVWGKNVISAKVTAWMFYPEAPHA